MVAAGPSPGSTPMIMPISTPTRQYSRLWGSTTTANPSRNAVMFMEASECQEVGQRDPQRVKEQEVKDRRGQPR